jgi:glycerophosphoryl diester phosphodiesterase
VSARPDLRGAEPFVVAHRGGAAETTENALESFARAVAAGFPWAECDVRALRDGTPVVVHDAHVRLRGDAADRPVAELTPAEWAEVDLSAHHGPAAAGRTAPTFAAFAALPWGATKAMIEVKPTADDLALGTRVAGEARRAFGPARCVIASFSPAVLRAAAAAEPELALMALIDAETPPAAFAGQPVSAYGVDAALADRELVAGLAVDGRVVWSWTVKDLPTAERLLEAGVRGLICDAPTAVTTLLAARRRRSPPR